MMTATVNANAGGSFLRMALLLDTVATGATALLLAVGAGWLTGLLGLPVGLMRGAGLALIPFTALVGYLATRSLPPRALVMLVIAINIAWTAASFLLLVSGAVSPTVLGTLFVAAQALAVGGFAVLQIVGVKRSV